MPERGIVAFIEDQAGGLLVDFHEEILGVISKLAGHQDVKQLTGEPDVVRAARILIAFAQSPDALADKAEEAIEDVFSEFAANKKKALQQELSDWVEDLKQDLLRDVPEGAQPLFQRLSELTEPHVLPVEFKTGKALQLANGISFDMNGMVGLHFMLESMTVEQIDLGPARIDSAFDQVLRIAFQANLNGAVSNAGFFGRGRFALEAGGAAGVSLDYYYRHVSQRHLITALVNDFQSFPSPFKIDDIAAAGRGGLTQIRLGVHGNVQVGLQVAAGHSFVGELGSNRFRELGIEEAVGVSAEAGIKFSGEIRRTGRYALYVTPTDEHKVVVSLHADTASEREAGLSLDVGVSVSGLDRIAVPVISQNLPAIEHLVSLLDELKDPGAWLRTKLKNALLPETGGLKKKIVEAFLDDEKMASEVIGAALEDTVNLTAINWTARAKKEADTILARLEARLPLSEALRAELTDSMRVDLEKAIGAYLKEIEGRIKGAGKAVVENLKPLFTAFDVAEESFDGIVGKLSQKSKELVEPFAHIVNRYLTLRTKLLSAAAGATSLSAKLTFGKAWARVHEQDVELALELDTTKQIAAKLLRQMLYGNFVDAMRLAAEPTAGVTLVSSRISEYLRRQNTTFLNFSLLDQRLSYASFAKSEIRVTRDVSGTISMFWGNLQAMGMAGVMDRQKTASVTNNLMLTAANHDAGSRLINNTGAALSFSDEKMDPEEIDTYLRGAVGAGLIGRGVQEGLERQYKSLLVNSAAESTAATVELAMTLEPGVFVTAAQNEASTLHRLALQALMSTMPDGRFFDTVRGIARDMGPTSDPVQNLLQLEHFLSGPATVRNEIQRKFEEASGLTLRESAPETRRMLSALYNTVRLARDFQQAVMGLAKLTQLDPSAADFTAKVDQLQIDIAENFKGWADVDAISLIWDDRIPRRNLALMIVLKAISGQDEPMVGVVSKRLADETRVDTLILA